MMLKIYGYPVRLGFINIQSLNAQFCDKIANYSTDWD